MKFLKFKFYHNANILGINWSSLFLECVQFSWCSWALTVFPRRFMWMYDSYLCLKYQFSSSTGNFKIQAENHFKLEHLTFLELKFKFSNHFSGIKTFWLILLSLFYCTTSLSIIYIIFTITINSLVWEQINCGVQHLKWKALTMFCQKLSWYQHAAKNCNFVKATSMQLFCHCEVFLRGEGEEGRLVGVFFKH